MQSKSSSRKVEFAAGRLNFDPATKKVTSDPRQGKVNVYVNPQGEKHFEWTDIKTSKKELDLYVFENDAKFSKVVKSSGRVYLLDFQTYDDKYFFWMQEKEPESDDEICNKVSKIIDWDGTDDSKIDIEPEQPQRSTGATQPKPSGGAGGVNPLLSNVRNVSNLGSLGNLAGFTGQRGGNFQAEDLTKMLQQALAQQQQQTLRKQTPPLNDIFTPQFLDSIIGDSEFQAGLIPQLPEGQQDVQGLRDSVKSAQLQQAIDTLDEALNSEEVGTVLISLGLDVTVLKEASDGTDALVKALEKWAKSNESK